VAPNNPQLKRLQAWYPDPPRVIFLFENEHPKLRWHKAEESEALPRQVCKAADGDSQGTFVRRLDRSAYARSRGHARTAAAAQLAQTRRSSLGFTEALFFCSFYECA